MPARSPARCPGWTVAAAAGLWMTISSGADRVLYTSLTDAERAKVVETLEAGGIAYAIDSATGALSVSENDVYRAKMLVASNAGIAAPEADSSVRLSAPQRIVIPSGRAVKARASTE